MSKIAWLLLGLSCAAYAGPSTIRRQHIAEFDQLATPAVPGKSTRNRVYFKSDNKLYGLTYGGIESRIGSDEGENLLSNPGFEDTLGTSWTATGGTLARTTTAAKVGTGSGAGSWDSSASTQKVCSEVDAIPVGLRGRNGVASCQYLCNASDSCTHKILAFDGTNDLGNATIIGRSTLYARTSVNFVYPSSGNVQLCTQSVASDEPELEIDNCILGPADTFNTSQVNQATAVGTLKISDSVSCGGWSTSSSTYSDHTAATGTCAYSVSGSVTAPGTQVPHAVVSNAPPGVYEVYAETTIFNGTSPQGGQCRLVDGDGTVISTPARGIFTNNNRMSFPMHGQVTYTTSGTRTFKIQCIAFSSGTVTVGDFSNASSLAEFSITRFPSSSEQGYRPDQTPASWSGYHTVAGGFGTASTTYATVTAGTTPVVTQTTGRNLTCLASGTDAAISCTLPKTGMYKVCAYPTVAANAATNASVRLLESGGSTVIHPGTTATIDQNNDYEQFTVCGDYLAGSLSAVFRVQMAASGGTTLNITNGAASGSGAIQWQVTELDAAMPTPLLVGSVTSNTTGIERIERAKITGGNPPSIDNQSGTWLTYTSRAGAGDYTWALSGFSAHPVCVCTVIASTLRKCSVLTGGTSTTLNTYVTDLTGTGQDTDFNLICMGPR